VEPPAQKDEVERFLNALPDAVASAWIVKEYIENLEVAILV